MADHPAIPCYFHREDGGFRPTGLARSPWSRDTLAGGPVSALLATIAHEAGFAPGFQTARFSLDILGTVPRTLLTPRIVPVREGRQMQLHRIEIAADDRVVAQAHVLRVREASAPAFAAPCPYPPPDSVPEREVLVGAAMAGAIRTRPVSGTVREPGRGIVWLSCDGEIVSGTAPPPFVKAALFADFGNGVGSATHAHEWSYANLDITLQFLRMPVGNWYLIDAETTSAGNGHATAMSTFADAQGVYARGIQTVFVGPGRGA